MRSREIVTALLFAFLVASGLSVFVLLIPVPNEMAIRMPNGLACQYFSASRIGWGCSRFGNFTEQPVAIFAAFAVSLLCAAWLRSYLLCRLPLIAILLLHWSFFIGLAGLLGSIYFLLGNTRFPHGIVSMLALGLWPACYLLLKFRYFARIADNEAYLKSLEPKQTWK